MSGLPRISMGARAVVATLCAGQEIKGRRHRLDRARPEEENRARLAAGILASPAYDSTAARVKAFVEQQGGCRATFFNYQRRLQGVPPAKRGS